MCHMIADTEDELKHMAYMIGVNHKWYQGDHFDICQLKRTKAVSLGAVEITWRQAGCMVKRRKITGQLGHHNESEAWLVEYFKGIKQARTLVAQ